MLKSWVQEIALLNWAEKLKLFHFKVEDGKLGQDNSKKLQAKVMKSFPNKRELFEYVRRKPGEILIGLLGLKGEGKERSKYKEVSADKQSSFFAYSSIKSFVD